jgi:hypothetical protein
VYTNFTTPANLINPMMSLTAPFLRRRRML